MALSDWAESVAAASRDVVCSALATNEALAGWIDAVWRTNWNGSLASAVRRGFCSNPSAPPDPSDYIQFTGGQCPGVTYRVQADYQFAPSPATGFPGPEGSLDDTIEGPITYQNPFTVPDGEPNQGFKGVAWIGSNGDRVSVIINPSGFDGVSVSNVSITREDGLPDDCGNPPPQIPPYEPSPISRDVTYVNNEGNQVTENYNFTLNAPVLVGGNIFAPVTIAGNDFELEAEITLDGEFEFNFGDEPGGDTVTDGEPPDSAIDDDEPESDDPRIIAVLVSSTVDTDVAGTTLIAQTDNPDVYVPDLGLISFRIAVSDGFTGWTSDERVKNVRQYIPCPAPQGAVEVKGSPRPGVTWALTPVYSRRDARFLPGTT